MVKKLIEKVKNDKEMDFCDAIHHEFCIINISVTLKWRFAKVNMWKQLQLHEQSKTIFWLEIGASERKRWQQQYMGQN